jgi:hypothetical protein
MKTTACAVVLLALLFPAPLAAQSQCESDLASLSALYELRSVLLRPGTGWYDVHRSIGERLHDARGPRSEGGYQWVRWVRPAGEGPIVKREHTVVSTDTAGHDVFEARGANTFEVRVVVPRKRSLTRANNPVHVGDVSIRYKEQGTARTLERKLDGWLQPGSSKSYELPGIVDEATVVVGSSTRPGKSREALVEVHFRQAVPEDDPQNPEFDTIRLLRRLEERGSIDALNLDLEIARLERALFPRSEPVAYTTLVTRIVEAHRLIESTKPEDQEKGRKLLTELVRMLPR